ncbi:MAG: hypothetical protein OEW12_05715 [Deltaproteobacteria bacterium]|nr:hypothetical protein [Deltaproteobacteria bacterium]
MELNLDWRHEESALWPGVTYQLRPLRVWAFQELMAFWESRPQPEARGDGPPAARRLGAADTLEFMAVAGKVLPPHVRQLQGLILIRDGEKHPATVESLCEETPLTDLAGEILSRLITLSEIRPEREKN